MSRSSRTTRGQSSTKKPDTYNNPPESPGQRMLAKLKQSDLDESDAKLMRLMPCTEAQATKLGLTVDGKAVAPAGFTIPYWMPDGTPFDRMFRYRSFETVIKKIETNGFLKGMESTTEIPKYLQPEGSDPHIYFPRVGGNDWEKVMSDTNRRVFITEGEMKSACACKKGYTTIGIGGVYSFGSKARHQRLLPELEAFKWEEREVVIVFDSDASINRNVVIAESRLARVLSERRAQVKAVRLPTLPGMEKTGWDDFLVKAGPKKFQQLLDETGLYPELEEMYKLNAEMLMVLHPPLILFYPDEHHPEDQQWYRMRTIAETVNAVMADRKIRTTTEEDKVKETSAAKAWVGSPIRASADSLCYEPGRPQWVGKQFNLWTPWPYEPKKGNIDPILELSHALMANGLPENEKWLWQWFAYPVQYAGAKLRTAVIMWGRTQGTGKSLLGKTIAHVYGKNAGTIGHKQLRSEFNGWAQGMQFIVGEEITGGQKREHADALKSLITEPEVLLNQKYLSEILMRNCINFYMTSNHPDPIFLSDKDRRYFVHEVLEHGLMKPAKFFADYAAWLYMPDKITPRPEAVSAIYWYLLHEVDTEGFDLYAPAPRTKFFAAMAEANMSYSEKLARSIRDAEGAEEIFGKLCSADLWTCEQFMKALRNKALADNNGEMARVNEKSLTQALTDDGIPHTENAPWVTLDGVKTRKRVWTLFHQDRYKGWGAQSLGDELSVQWGAKVEKKKKYS